MKKRCSLAFPASGRRFLLIHLALCGRLDPYAASISLTACDNAASTVSKFFFKARRLWLPGFFDRWLF
jgi:hypothetical protein